MKINHDVLRVYRLALTPGVNLMSTEFQNIKRNWGYVIRQTTPGTNIMVQVATLLPHNHRN